MAQVQLHEIAHGRTGDKGNRLNISLIAFRAEVWPILLEQVTVERVHALFRHRGATKVVRYVLPKLQAMNFVIDDVLEGGVNSSLAVDAHGKSHSFRLLGLHVEVPDNILQKVGLAKFPAVTLQGTETEKSRELEAELATGK
jgi:hypothetical protein